MITLTRSSSHAARVLACLFAMAAILSAQGGFNGAGRYEISNIQSGKVLDLDRNDQTTVIQFSSRNTDNQLGSFRRPIPVSSSFAI